jgi:hypothetical protein
MQANFSVKAVAGDFLKWLSAQPAGMSASNFLEQPVLTVAAF